MLNFLITAGIVIIALLLLLRTVKKLNHGGCSS